MDDIQILMIHEETNASVMLTCYGHESKEEIRKVVESLQELGYDLDHSSESLEDEEDEDNFIIIQIETEEDTDNAIGMLRSIFGKENE